MTKEFSHSHEDQVLNEGGLPVELLQGLLVEPYVNEAVMLEVESALLSEGISSETFNSIRIKRIPENADGDYGLHCGLMAKELKKNPALIAEELVSKLTINPNGFITEYTASGPYLNFKVDHTKFATDVVKRVREMGLQYGSEKIGNFEHVVIDMSSPNIAKRMSVGHLRSTIIGDSLARIYDHMGYQVTKDNHIGDWGTQFGHLLHGIYLWGDVEKIAQDPINELQKLYVKISSAGDPQSDFYDGIDENVAQKKAADTVNAGREWFKRLEGGDQEARKIWQQIVDWSLNDFQRLYDILDVDFDIALGESFYEPMLQDVINEVNEKGVGVESRGALIIDLNDVNLGVGLIQKSDGATLYMTRDIAAAIYRVNEMSADKMIYVVGEDQKHYFEQLFEALRRLGYDIADESVHVYFGMVSLPEGKMSTRKGRVILLEDVISEAMAKTEQKIGERTRIADQSEKDKLVRDVAIGALKWNDLMADPKRSIVFDWDQMLSMEGNSAPYVQYSHARAKSILEKSELAVTSDQIVPQNHSEKQLAFQLADFPDAVKRAAENNNPSIVAMYLFELAKQFTVFYHDVLILSDDEQEQLTRIGLTEAFAITIKTGLNLLGIKAPDNM